MSNSDPTDLDALLEELHAQLRATEELPIRPDANRWLGEAQAVAADVARGDPSTAVIEERVGQIGHLLERADETGSPEADERVAAALELVEEIRRR